MMLPTSGQQLGQVSRAIYEGTYHCTDVGRLR
jgi:hypothetical protein